MPLGLGAGSAIRLLDSGKGEYLVDSLQIAFAGPWLSSLLTGIHLQGVLKEPNIGKEAAQGLLGLVTAYGRGDVSTMMKNMTSFYKKATKGDAAQEKSLKTKTSPADVVMWSGSKDEQKSYVVFFFLSP